MSDFKPKPTKYDGYIFRSRLEARWAVFFNAIGLVYEYEPQGFELRDGVSYLPDFYLPALSSYFEVKRLDLSGRDVGLAIAKIESVARGTDRAGIICFGDPVDDKLLIFCNEADEDGGGSWGPDNVTIGLRPGTHDPYLFSFVSGKERGYWADESFSIALPMTNEWYDRESGVWRDRCADFVTTDVIAARERARRARFEYGTVPSSKTLWG